MKRVLTIAGLLSLGYGLELLIDLARPTVGDSEPAIGLFTDLTPALPRTMFWAVVASWVAVPLVCLVGAVVRLATPDPGERARVVRALQVFVAVTLLLPFTVFPVATAAKNLTALLVCVPTTGFGLWAVHRMQRFRRVPVWLLLALFGWGMFLANGFGASMNIWYMNYAPAFFRDAGNPLQVMQQVNTWACLNAGVFEELGKGAGVAIACVAVRRHIDGVVTGIVLGAAAGLGFNFVETIEYMTTAGDQGAGLQFWMRQAVGLMGAHTAFAAVAGAGLGVARQLHDPKLRRTAILCGFLAAVSGHFASNIAFRWLGQQKTTWSALSPAVDMLVLQPLVLVVTQGPFVVMYLLLLRHGLRSQAAGLAGGLRTEAGTGSGAVTDREIPLLLNPIQRWWLRITVLRRFGFAAHRNLVRLHAAQFDLATHRWHQVRHEVDRQSPDERVLRERVFQLKRRHAALLAGHLAPVRVPA